MQGAGQYNVGLPDPAGGLKAAPKLLPRMPRNTAAAVKVTRPKGEIFLAQN